MDILDLIKIYDLNNDLLYSINEKVIESYNNKNIKINPYNRHIIKYNDFIVRLPKLSKNIQLKLFRIITFMITNEEDTEIDFEFKNTYINKNKYWLVKINDIDMNYIKFKYKEEDNIEKLF
jgi:hypothetical protein